jgi:hypothetical protein
VYDDDPLKTDDPMKTYVRRKVRRIVAILVGVLFVMPLVIALFGGAVMLLWNWLMPTLFGLHTVTFWQALGLLVLSWMLFGGHRGFRGRGGRSRWRERRKLREAMTPEQRAEMRRRMADGWGRCAEPAVTAPGEPQAD